MSKNRYILIVSVILFLVVAILYVNHVCHEPTKNLETLPQKTDVVTDVALIVEEIPEIPKYDIPLSDELQVFTYSECEKRNLSYEMVLAIMWTESKMDITATNHNSDGSIDGGILQINSGTGSALAEEIGIFDFNSNDPYESIQVGVYYLSILRDNFSKYLTDEDTFPTVCMAYNRGGNNTKRMIERNGISFVHNSDYVKTVRKYKEEIETIGTFSDYVKE